MLPQTGFCEPLPSGPLKVLGPACLADARVRQEKLMDFSLLFCSMVLVPALSLGLRYECRHFANWFLFRPILQYAVQL